MNSTAARHTPLECLLLFQSLVTHGTDDKSFLQISDLLTNNIFVRDGDTYDAGRLRSDALRELYLELLREELKAEEDAQEDGVHIESKKRKATSPALPTVKDAEQHRTKLPILVDRLYAQYRSSMVEAIKEDERRYAILQQEVDEIKRGEWDERISKENAAMANKNGLPSPMEKRPKLNGTSSSPQGQLAGSPTPPLQSSQPVDRQSSAPRAERKPDGAVVKDLSKSGESVQPSAPLVAALKGQSAPQNLPSLQRRPSSTGPHGPSPLQPSPQQSHTPQPGMAYKWETPMFGPPHPSQPYQQGGPHPPQFTPQQYPAQPYPSPRGSFANHALHHPHVPSSPSLTQPPHGMAFTPGGGHRSPGSPHGMDALADAAGQQYRANSGSPMLQPPQMHGAPMQPPPPASYPTTYPSHRTNSGPGAPTWNNQPYPQYQGTPYQGSSSLAVHPQQQTGKPVPPRPDLIPSENKQYTSPYNASQGARPPLLQSMSKSVHSLPSTPMSVRYRFSTGSGTQWTPKPTVSTPKADTAMDSPAMEPLSPVLRSKSMTAKKISKQQSQKADPTPKRAVQKRGTQRTRAGSTASSVMAGSYRSQSVTSHADELSLNVKEEVATPLPLPSGLDDEMGDTTADESQSNTRTRPSRILTSPSRLKRKRNDSMAETPLEPQNPATHVLWTRRFVSISAPAFNSAHDHRHASMFAAPVKERDAPGYKHLILRPQDLKSIKSQINAGHKAALAAAPEDIPSTQSNVWLPISEDLIPPKGIINYGQLEKELMRMFANAIMFNADPDRGLGATWDEMRGHGKTGGEGYEIDEDGVVKDTRAMYADVEKTVEALRSAERQTEEAMRGSSNGVRGSSVMGAEDDVDELAEAETSTGTLAKRRRKQ